jgi:hypothetical protein
VGFISPQFDFIDQRFTHRRIKTLDVICTENVQAVLDDPELVVDDDPDLVNQIIDPDTGQLQPGVSVVVTDIDPGVSVVPNKVCNIFVVTWQIVDSTGTVLAGPFTNVVSDEVDCPGAGVGPSQTVVQKHDIQVMVCLIPVDTDDNGEFDTLYGTIDIDYCLVVANEVILKINAARPFCP